MLSSDQRDILRSSLNRRGGIRYPAERLRGPQVPRKSRVTKICEQFTKTKNSSALQRMDAFMEKPVVMTLLGITMFYIGTGLLRCVGVAVGRPPDPIYVLDFWWLWFVR